jgi:hypothetical protein
MRSVTATCAIVRDLVRIALELAVVAGLALCLGLTPDAADLMVEVGSSAVRTLDPSAETASRSAASTSKAPALDARGGAKISLVVPDLAEVKRPGTPTSVG